MGSACCTSGRENECLQGLVKAEGKISLLNGRRKWEIIKKRIFKMSNLGCKLDLSVR
jgi:hypothetical protein